MCAGCGTILDPSDQTCPICGADRNAPVDGPSWFEKPPDKPPAVEGVAKACPRCGKDLELGFLATTARPWITWTEQRGILDAAPWRTNKLLVSDRIGTSHVPGLRCRKCGLLILDLRGAD